MSFPLCRIRMSVAPMASQLLDAAGRLWLAGVELDWANLHPGAEPTAGPAADLSLRAQTILGGGISR